MSSPGARGGTAENRGFTAALIHLLSASGVSPRSACRDPTLPRPSRLQRGGMAEAVTYFPWTHRGGASPRARYACGHRGSSDSSDSSAAPAGPPPAEHRRPQSLAGLAGLRPDWTAPLMLLKRRSLAVTCGRRGLPKVDSNGETEKDGKTNFGLSTPRRGGSGSAIALAGAGRGMGRAPRTARAPLGCLHACPDCAPREPSHHYGYAESGHRTGCPRHTASSDDPARLRGSRLMCAVGRFEFERPQSRSGSRAAA